MVNNTGEAVHCIRPILELNFLYRCTKKFLISIILMKMKSLNYAIDMSLFSYNAGFKILRFETF